MKIKSLFLAVLIFQTISRADVLEKVLCKQFYLNDRTITVFDLLKRQASDNMKFSPESYYPYLSKLFPEFSEVELVMLLAQNIAKEKMVVARRILKTSGSSEITLSNVQALAEVLNSHADKAEVELYREVRKKLIDGLKQGYTTMQIINEMK